MPRVIPDWHGRDPKSRNFAREHRQVYPLTSDQVDKMLHEWPQCQATPQHLEMPVNGSKGPLTTLRDARPETRFARMVLLKAREIGRMINYAAGARGVSGGGQKG
jgi:hypothetical protein